MLLMYPLRRIPFEGISRRGYINGERHSPFLTKKIRLAKYLVFW